MILSRTWGFPDFSFINRAFFGVVGEAVSFSLCNTVFKDPSLCVIVGRRISFLVLKSQFVAISEGSCSFAESADPALIIRSLGDVIP